MTSSCPALQCSSGTRASEYTHTCSTPPKKRAQQANRGPSDADEGVWIWTTEDGAEMYFDKGEAVRFRVESEKWHDQAPQKPTSDRSAPAPPDQPPPYSIEVSEHRGSALR